MAMPGGGPWHCGAGQVTDDSELAMCLLWGLINSEGFAMKAGQGELVKDLRDKGKTLMNVEAIAKMYASWVKSNPFDIGNTTRGTIGKLVDPNATAKTAVLNSQGGNFKDSTSNGSCMRVTPLAVWAAGISNPEVHKKVISADV